MKSLGARPVEFNTLTVAELNDYCECDINLQSINIELITAMIGMYVESGDSIEEAVAKL